MGKYFTLGHHHISQKQLNQRNRQNLTFPFLLLQGCKGAVEAVLKKNIQWVIVAALVIAFLQVCNISKQKNVASGAKYNLNIS